MLFKLSFAQDIPITLKEAWSFFSDPKNLAVITPPELDFTVTSNPPASMYPGLIITYTVRPLLNIKTPWVTEITHVQEPSYFVDEQRSGPYKLWHHQHHFQQTSCGVYMEDIVHYSFGLPLIDSALNALIVEPQIKKIFEYRKRKIEALFPMRPTTS